MLPKNRWTQIHSYTPSHFLFAANLWVPKKIVTLATFVAIDQSLFSFSQEKLSSVSQRRLNKWMVAPSILSLANRTFTSSNEPTLRNTFPLTWSIWIDHRNSRVATWPSSPPSFIRSLRPPWLEILKFFRPLCGVIWKTTLLELVGTPPEIIAGNNL